MRPRKPTPAALFWMPPQGGGKDPDGQCEAVTVRGARCKDDGWMRENQMILCRRHADLGRKS